MNRHISLSMKILKSLAKSYHQAEDYFFRGISGKYSDIGQDATAYLTGVETADLNILFVRQLSQPFQNIAQEALRFYEAYNQSFVIVIPEDLCNTAVQATLSLIRYVKVHQSVAMVRELDKANTIDGDDIAIKQTNDNLKDWSFPLIEAFKSTPLIIAQYENVHKYALDRGLGLYHHTLYEGVQPVSSITLSIHNNMVRIDDLCTLPDFQGKGYATRLVRHALAEAAKMGAEMCFLDASEEGLSLYKNLRFLPLFKYNIYEEK
jgi:GNAT superfamily N-acetyltransferase